MNWTQEKVSELIRHARNRDPRWSWKIVTRHETIALLDIDPGLLWHPDSSRGPLEVVKFNDCELWAIDLIDDFVVVNAVDEHGLTPNEVVPGYWLDLHTGAIAQWTANTIDEITNNKEGRETP